MNKKLQTICDKCGAGNIYRSIDAVNLHFKHRRESLGKAQKEVCDAIGISDISQLSKFEKNHLRFSEARLRKLDAYYTKLEKRT